MGWASSVSLQPCFEGTQRLPGRPSKYLLAVAFRRAKLSNLLHSVTCCRKSLHYLPIQFCDSLVEQSGNQVFEVNMAAGSRPSDNLAQPCAS